MLPDLLHTERDASGKSQPGVRGTKSFRNVREAGSVKGSRKISGLADMHEKPNGSNEILGMAIDGDIHHYLFKYSTPQLFAQI